MQSFDSLLAISDESHYLREQNFIYDPAQICKDASYHKFKYENTKNYSTTKVETEFAKIKLNNIFNQYSINKNSTLLEVGCNNGRITNLLLGMDCNRVVATDIDYHAAKALHVMNNHNYDNLLIIVENANKLPLKEECVDTLVAWGILSLLEPQTVANILKHLRPGGILISAEPLLDHVLLYSLVMQDLQEFVRCFKSSSRPAVWADKENRYPVKSRKQIHDMMNAYPLELIAEDGINIFPALIFGGLLQEHAVSDSEKKLLYETILEIETAGICNSRQLIMVFRKR